MFVLNELHINTIGTLPEEEGRGIATSLLDDAWADAKKRGITRATLEVAVSNQRAIDLYLPPTALDPWAFERTIRERPTRMP